MFFWEDFKSFHGKKSNQRKILMVPVGLWLQSSCWHWWKSWNFQHSSAPTNERWDTKKTTNMIVAPVCMCIFWYLLIYHEMCWYLWFLMVDIDSFSSSALWGLVTVNIMFDIDRGSVVDLVWDSLIWFQSSFFRCFLCFSITVDWVNLRFCS